jgi:hypothetical protein
MLGYVPTAPTSHHSMHRPARHPRLLLLVATSALWLAASPAAAANAEIAWSAEGVHEQTYSVGPTAPQEVCGRLDAGTRIRWRFESDAPTDFNIHHHVGREVRFSAQEKGSRRAEGRFEAKEPHDYCWMWTRGAGPAATVRMRLERER